MRLLERSSIAEAGIDYRKVMSCALRRNLHMREAGVIKSCAFLSFSSKRTVGIALLENNQESYKPNNDSVSTVLKFSREDC